MSWWSVTSTRNIVLFAFLSALLCAGSISSWILALVGKLEGQTMLIVFTILGIFGTLLGIWGYCVKDSLQSGTSQLDQKSRALAILALCLLAVSAVFYTMANVWKGSSTSSDQVAINTQNLTETSQGMYDIMRNDSDYTRMRDAAIIEWIRGIHKFNETMKTEP